MFNLALDEAVVQFQILKEQFEPKHTETLEEKPVDQLRMLYKEEKIRGLIDRVS